MRVNLDSLFRDVDAADAVDDRVVGLRDDREAPAGE